MENYNTKNQSKMKIYIRPELFDHLIYPLTAKLDDNLILLLFRKLHVSSEIDFKIPLKSWVTKAKEIGLSEIEANILFQTYKVFDNDNSEYSNNLNSRYESANSKNSVDVRYFGLFFALQSFAFRTKVSLNIDKGDKSPSYFTSPLSSPRGKNLNSLRNQNQGLEYQYFVNLIKSNLKLFLRIIASDIHNTETTINMNEFNTLKFLFKLDENDLYKSSTLNNNNTLNKNKNTLSNYTHFFDNLPSVAKIGMNKVNEFLSELISTTPPEKSDYIQIKNLSKSVTIKNDCINKNIKITQCDDSYIYINTNVQNCKISHCSNCTIVIAVVSKIITLDKCEKCNISLVSNFTRISNMIDSNVYMYSVNEPVLYGDNRGLCLGPHNVTYQELYLHLKNSRLLITQKGIVNFNNPIFFNNKKDIKIISIENFTTLIVPFEVKDEFAYKLTPKNYVESIENRYKNYLKIKNMIREANFSEKQEKAFHIALQGFFREWLVTSGNYRPMNDIVKMIDNPQI